MSLLQFDGFEIAQEIVQQYEYGQLCRQLAGTNEIKRSGVYSFMVQNDGGGQQLKLAKQFNTNSNIMIAGLGIYINSLSSNGNFNISFIDTTSNTKFTLRVNPSNFQLLKNNNVITTIPIYLSINSQYYLEFKCILGNPDGTAGIRIGKKLTYDVTSSLLNTQQNILNKVELYYYDPLKIYIDDFYVVDGSGDITDYLGPCSAYLIGPDTLYDQTDFTCVGTTDFVAAVKKRYYDNATPFITSDKTNAFIEYRPQASIMDKRIHGLRVCTGSMRGVGDGGVRWTKYLKNTSDNSVYEYGSLYHLNTEVTMHSFIFEKNVFTNNLQTRNDFTNIVFGAKVIDT